MGHMLGVTLPNRADWISGGAAVRKCSPYQAARLALLFLFACGPVSALASDYSIPERLNDGWDTADLKTENIDARRIAALLDAILSNDYKNITSLLLVKHNKLVVEEYFPTQFGGRAEQALRRVAPQPLFSATKSVNSILIGLAVQQHLIHGVDQNISTFFPEYADIFADSDRSKLTVKDFLTMSAGLSWDEWTYSYTDPRNSAVATILSPDPIRHVLDQPVVALPGAKFVYASGIAQTLGQIIYKVSGLRADRYAEQNLFQPLGISDYYWSKLPNDIVETGGGLFLRARDMAKIGFLFLNGGRWQGKQIIDEQWVKDSTTNHIDPSQIPAWVEADGYGYQWWSGSFKVGHRTIKSWSARGRGGQFIFIFPDQRMVAIFTGANEGPLLNQPLDMLERYILPAVLPPTTRP